jgi:hypothetical protein
MSRHVSHQAAERLAIGVRTGRGCFARAVLAFARSAGSGTAKSADVCAIDDALINFQKNISS